MNKDKAIQLLERLQDPEPYEPMLTKDAYDAIQMAIDALENQKSVCEEYCEYEDCEAERMVVQSLSSLYPLKEFEEIAIDKVLDAVKKPKRIKGRWIPSDTDGFVCSVCRNGYRNQPTLMGKPMFEFCPVCGAKMDGEVTE